MRNCPDRLTATARKAGCDVLASLHPDEDVAVIVVQLPEAPCELLDRADALSPGERARAEEFRFARHRERFLARRILLRLWLAEELDMRPEKIRMECTPQGKLFIVPEGGALSIADFSISSSSESMGMAIHRTGRIGVDIEHGRTEQDVTAMLESICSPEESRILRHLPPTTKEHAFLQLWTAKEAYLKAVGTGLLRSPDSVTVQWDTTGSTPEIEQRSLRGWRLNPAVLPCGCHVCTCWELAAPTKQQTIT